MSVSTVATRTRLGGLAAAFLAAGALVAQAAPAGAAPAPSGSSTVSGSVGTTAPSSAGRTGSSTAPASGGTSSTSPTRRPAATPPPAPTDYGPPCTTDAKAPYPVVCLPDGSGEDKPAALTPGDGTEFDAQVVNNGPDVANATVVVTLPKGLGLESDEDDPIYRIDDWYSDDDDDGDYTDLTCQAGAATGGASTITCQVGPLPTHANILIAVDLVVADDATPGTTLDFGVALQPAGDDEYAATSVTASITVLEPTNLQVSLTPATLRTVVGHHATMTGVVHNAGPGTAPDSVAVALTVDEKHPNDTHFTITNGTDPTEGQGFGSSGSTAAGDPESGDGSTVVIIGGSSPKAQTALRARLQRQALAHGAPGTVGVARHALPQLRFWPIGTLAPGATTTVPIELKALTVGTDTLTFGAIAASESSDCDDEGEGSSGSSSAPAEPDPSDSLSASTTQLARVPAGASTTAAPADCSFMVTTHITAIKAPAASEPLAATGTNHLDRQLGLALWALVLGSALVWFGRRRVTGHRRHG